MPRHYSAKRWLRQFEDLEFKKEVFTTASKVWERRPTMPYPDVVRAKALILALEPEKGTVSSARDFALKLDISLGNLWNYLTRDVPGWMERMNRRLTGNQLLERERPIRLRLSDADLEWIGIFLRGHPYGSLTAKLSALHRAAHEIPERKHLGRLPLSTLWDHLADSEHLAQIAEDKRKKCTRKHPRESKKVPRDRDLATVGGDTGGEFIEPDAVVLPDGQIALKSLLVLPKQFADSNAPF
jgi:hypothetical protein